MVVEIVHDVDAELGRCGGDALDGAPGRQVRAEAQKRTFTPAVRTASLRACECRLTAPRTWPPCPVPIRRAGREGN